VTKRKPIDRWLALLSVAIGIAYSLLPKTPSVVVVSLGLIFLLLLHPIWNFWWIEESIGKRTCAVIALAIFCSLLGFVGWPTADQSNEEPIGFKISGNSISSKNNISMNNRVGFDLRGGKVDAENNVAIGNNYKESQFDGGKHLGSPPSHEIDVPGIIGNTFTNNGKGALNIEGDEMLLEANLADGKSVLRNDANIDGLLKQHVLDRQAALKRGSVFDEASSAAAAANDYALYGRWPKAIAFAYEAFGLYMHVKNNDSSRMLALIPANVRADLLKDGCISEICTHLSFIALRIRHERDKNYAYCLNQLYIMAKAKKDSRALGILEKRIASKDTGSFNFKEQDPGSRE
jgi:hypothetical protein